MKQTPKIFLALPIYGGVDPHFFTCMLKLVTQPPFEIHTFPLPGDSLVARARNRCASVFLKSDCTHLMFIDSDIIFSPEQVKHLVDRDVDIVGGLYPKKQRDLAWVCNAFNGTDTADETGLQSVKYMGTGFLLIKRRVFERMVNELPELQYHPDDGENSASNVLHDFFRCGTHKHADGRIRYLSEDWFFCQMALDLGFKVYADCKVHLKHVGQFIYPLDDPRKVQAQIPQWLEDEVKQYYMPLDFTPSTVLDIGANIGAWTKRAAQQWPGCKIIAIEPMPENLVSLNVNAPEGVQILPYAVREKGGKVLIRKDVPPTGHTCIGATPQNGLEVDCIAASQLSSAEFVKIDTEGCELEIVAGLDFTKTRAAVVEWHREGDDERITNIMAARGFNLVESVPCDVKFNGILKFKKP